MEREIFRALKKIPLKLTTYSLRTLQASSTPLIDEVPLAIDSTTNDDSSKKPLLNDVIIADDDSKSISAEAIERIVVFFKDGTFISYNPK